MRVCVRASLYACACVYILSMCGCVHACECAYVCTCACANVHVCACDMRALERTTIVSDVNQLTYFWLNVECILTTDVFTI